MLNYTLIKYLFFINTSNPPINTKKKISNEKPPLYRPGPDSADGYGIGFRPQRVMPASGGPPTAATGVGPGFPCNGWPAPTAVAVGAGRVFKLYP